MVRHGFLDDYGDGAHPRVLESLVRANAGRQAPYGADEHSERARTLIRERVASPDAAVHFVASGTIANVLCIASALRPHEAVIAATSGHVAVHEAGAIEASGHKIIGLRPEAGKLTPALVESAVAANAHFPHMARPRLVYVSNATELGTVYRRTELEALSACCREHDLLLMVDGARLGVALAADANDATLEDVARLADTFWIGGTKNGALFGEAIVVPNAELAHDFAFHVKQRGALLAKGRALGAQFEALFADDLFVELAGRANATARALSTALVAAGVALSAPTESNQVFPILPDAAVERLREAFDFHVWGRVDETRSVVRLVTSWATEERAIDAFVAALGERSIG